MEIILSVEVVNYVATRFITFSCHVVEKCCLLLVNFHKQSHTHTYRYLGINMYTNHNTNMHTIYAYAVLFTLMHTRGNLVVHYSYSQSTSISAVNVNWRAVHRKQKTHFLKLTRFRRFRRFPFSPVFSGSFLLFDKR